MTTQAPTSAPDVHAEIHRLIAGKIALPVHADSDAPGFIYDAADQPVATIDMWGDRPDEDAFMIAQAIALALNAAAQTLNQDVRGSA